MHRMIQKVENDSKTQASGAQKIIVKGLKHTITEKTEGELKNIFSAYGAIDFVKLEVDPITKSYLGYAIIQYQNSADAQAAVKNLNGFTYNSKTLSVDFYFLSLVKETVAQKRPKPMRKQPANTEGPALPQPVVIKPAQNNNSIQSMLNSIQIEPIKLGPAGTASVLHRFTS